MRKLFATAAAAALISGGASASTVGDVFISSVVGVWTATTGTTASGIGTNEIRWGNPSPPSSDPEDQSGYKFVGAAPPVAGPFAEGEVFDLGEFTHFNEPITAPSITGATLQVTTEGLVDGVFFSILSVFEFDHFETVNFPGDGVCAAGGSTPCPDLVTPTLNVGASESVSIGGVDYFISVTGFDIGSSFLTLENATNTATLQGTFTADVSGVIPLPAAAWFLLAGVGGLAAVGRRKKAA